MNTALKTKIKAELISQAIYAATEIKPDIFYQENKKPLIAFSPENAKKIQQFLEKQLEKKSDIDIDIFPAIAPVIFKKVFPFAAAGIAAVFFTGYILGRR